jgi:hypothetical protein
VEHTTVVLELFKIFTLQVKVKVKVKVRVRVRVRVRGRVRARVRVRGVHENGLNLPTGSFL